MEKRTLLTIVACLAILVGWSTLSRALWPPPPPPPAAAPGPGTEPVRAGPGAPPARGTTSPAPGPVAGPEDVPAAPAVPERTVHLSSAHLDLDVSSAGGGTLTGIEAWGCTHHEAHDRSVPGDPGVLTSHVPGQPGFLAVDLLGTDAEGISRTAWDLVEADGGVVATVERGGLRVRKEIRLSTDPQHPYHVTLLVTVENAGAAGGGKALLDLCGPATLAHPRVATPEDGLLVAAVGESPEHLNAASVLETLQEEHRDERKADQGWQFVGVRTDFYLAALLPAPGTTLPPESVVALRAAQVAATRTAPAAAVAAAAYRIPFTVPAPGESRTWELLAYLGPNSRTILAAPGSAYVRLAGAYPQRSFLGISFAWITNLMDWLLTVFARGAGLGWGMAVCALTVLVRGALFPLSRKSQVSMRTHAVRMAKLKPKIDAIKAKHPDNPKKQQELTMRLFREEKVSILPGGCLLAFLQMPVWISLYGTLQTTFEMRHASFLWFHDLTAPDHLLELPFARGWPVIGGWLNLLPILMMITWFGSSLMQPLPPDPEQRAQAKMMRFIPLLFGVFLYQTAAGLTLYMTLSALWSIGETWLIRRLWLSKLETVTPADAAAGAAPAPARAS